MRVTGAEAPTCSFASRRRHFNCETQEEHYAWVHDGMAVRCHPPRYRRADREHPRLSQFGDGEEHGGVLKGVQGVAGLGNDQQVAVAPFPLEGVGNKAYPTM